ncbi:hypothetical protein BJ965_000001 [Streptomyces luteogriseus]|uniref:Uncharacterized protein n=1 Tax=Streptomyces luteogriseus TaxID=68233 RepID=A0A7W7GEJ9_9ACTN|nr:hypothetical protein [Streptomyces luteogriseus]
MIRAEKLSVSEHGIASKGTESCPAHADGGQLFDPVRRQRRGSGSLIPDPCAESELALLLVLVVAVVPVAVG